MVSPTHTKGPSPSHMCDPLGPCTWYCQSVAALRAPCNKTRPISQFSLVSKKSSNLTGDFQKHAPSLSRFSVPISVREPVTMIPEDKKAKNTGNNDPFQRKIQDEEDGMQLWGILLFGLIGASATTLCVKTLS